MKKYLPASTLVLGIAMVALSFAWSTLFPATNAWNEDKSRRLAELGGEVNLLRFEIVESEQNPSRDPRKETNYLKAQYQSKLQQYNDLQSEFEGARDLPAAASNFLLYAGAAVAALGALAFFVANRSA